MVKEAVKASLHIMQFTDTWLRPKKIAVSGGSCRVTPPKTNIEPENDGV